MWGKVQLGTAAQQREGSPRTGATVGEPERASSEELNKVVRRRDARKRNSMARCVKNQNSGTGGAAQTGAHQARVAAGVRRGNW